MRRENKWRERTGLILFTKIEPNKDVENYK